MRRGGGLPGSEGRTQETRVVSPARGSESGSANRAGSSAVEVVPSRRVSDSAALRPAACTATISRATVSPAAAESGSKRAESSCSESGGESRNVSAAVHVASQKSTHVLWTVPKYQRSPSFIISDPHQPAVE